MIKIMLDSASDCGGLQLCDYFIPMSVNIDGTEYRDGVDLTADKFYSLLTSIEGFPHTSQPSPDDFLKIFEEIKQNGDELLYFCISSGLSGTYQSANIAKAMAEYDKIYIIDTKSVSHLIGVLAHYAQKLIAEGLSARDIAEKCEELKLKTRVFAGVDTLEYLKRGGRIGKASALVGTLANIKPLITISPEGTVGVLGKALGFARAVQTITDKLEKCEIDTDFPIYTLYTYGEENCIKLEEKIKGKYSISDRVQVGPTIGAHVGPGVYGVFFVEK